MRSPFKKSSAHWSTGRIVISADPYQPAIQGVHSSTPVTDHHLSGRWFLTGFAVIPLVLWSVADIGESFHLVSAEQHDATPTVTVLPHVPTKAELAKKTKLPDFVSVPDQEG